MKRIRLLRALLHQWLVALIRMTFSVLWLFSSALPYVLLKLLSISAVIHNIERSVLSIGIANLASLLTISSRLLSYFFLNF